MYRLAFRLTREAHHAEDLVQDVLVKLYAREEPLDAIEQLRPWLALVMQRQFIDHVRKYSRAPVSLLDDRELSTANGDPYEHFASDTPGPEEEAQRSLDQKALLRAWERLGPEQRVLVALHDLEGYTLRELEFILETPIGTLKSRLHRARARLRELLGREPF